MPEDFTKFKFDVVIQAGQSNAQGCGLGDVDSPYVPSDDVWQMNNELSITAAAEEVEGGCAVGNFALPFAARYVADNKLATGRKLLILKSAVGGTGFLDNRWGMRDDLYLKMIEMIAASLALNTENRLVAFLWHQGESDAAYEASYDGHYVNLMTLAESVRDGFGRKDLPFIAGDFVHHWKNENSAACEPVVRAIKDVCADIGRAAFIETAGLQSNLQKLGYGDDNIHFSREALYILGAEYFRAYCKIANGAPRFEYDGEIMRLEGKIKWNVIYFPHSAREHFGSNGQIPVRITVDGHSFEHTLLPSANGHYFVYNEFIKRAVGKSLGDAVRVTLERDFNKREFTCPAAIENALKEAGVLEAFLKQPDYFKREQLNHIELAKKEETKANRLSALITRLGGKI